MQYHCSSPQLYFPCVVDCTLRSSKLPKWFQSCPTLFMSFCVMELKNNNKNDLGGKFVRASVYSSRDGNIVFTSQVLVLLHFMFLTICVLLYGALCATRQSNSFIRTTHII